MTGAAGPASETAIAAMPPAGGDRSADAAWHALHDAASAPYRGVGRFAWHFARGKLGRDPVFRALLERGDLAGRPRIVDIGCGQGLLASLLQACSALQQSGGWPVDWAPAPAANAYTGIELMPRDVARARRALLALPLAGEGRGECGGRAPTLTCSASPGLQAGTAQLDRRMRLETPTSPPAISQGESEQDLIPRFICGDMCTTPLPACDAVVILDVLHYVPHAAQAELLARVRSALQPHGRLLLRVGDAGDGRPFALSQWVDRIVTWTRGHRAAPTWGRPLAGWRSLLDELGFAAVRNVPMSRGTPFANVLLVADVAAPAATDPRPGTA